MTKRVCLLTGAGGRLGSLFCRQYAQQYAIAAVCRQRVPDLPSQNQQFVDPLIPEADLPENRHLIYTINAELTDDQELERVVELVLARFERIDLLVNAAVHSVWAPMIDSSRLTDSCDDQFRVNVTVPLKLATLVARRFWRHSGRENTRHNRNIVNVSSMAGLQIYPGSGQSIYGASKAALNFLTCHMADEFHSMGVRVNAVAPNSFPEIVPTEQVAESIVRLDQGQMTGQVLVFDRDARDSCSQSVEHACPTRHGERHDAAPPQLREF